MLLTIDCKMVSALFATKIQIAIDVQLISAYNAQLAKFSNLVNVSLAQTLSSIVRLAHKTLNVSHVILISQLWIRLQTNALSVREDGRKLSEIALKIVSVTIVLILESNSSTLMKG